MKSGSSHGDMIPFKVPLTVELPNEDMDAKSFAASIGEKVKVGRRIPSAQAIVVVTNQENPIAEVSL